MGCYSSKRKSQLDLTKSIDRQISTSKVLENEPKGLVIERHNHKYKGHQSHFPPNSTEIEAKNAEIIDHPKSSKDISEISKSLSLHFLFNSLAQESLAQVIDQIKLIVLGPKEVIFNQGLPAQNFYIVASGKVEESVNGKLKKVLCKGEQFGELALLNRSLRPNSAFTLEKAALWVLSGEDFRSAIQSISNKKYEENKAFIESIPIFSNFNNSQKEILLSMLVTHEYSSGQKIVTEGDPGNLLYIIKAGTVVCTKTGQEIRKLSQGDFFGEQALLYNTQRTATVSAVAKVTVLSIGREDLVIAFGSHLQQVIYRNSQRIAIEKSPVLKILTKTQSETVIDKMEISSYRAGQVVIGKGSHKNTKIVVVLKGCLKNGSETSGLYSCIGDSEVYNNVNEQWEENWLADIDSDVAVLMREDLVQLLGGQLGKIVSQNEVLNVLRRVQILRSLPLPKLESLLPALKIYEYNHGQTIFQEGDDGDAFYIVKEGQVEVFKEGISIRVITRHDFFGERSIILNEKRTATVVSQGKSACWSLSKRDFLAMIDEGIRKQLTKRVQLKNDSITLSDLSIIKLLGKGMFGNVFLALNNTARVFYALKTVQRTKINTYEIFDNLILERKILLQVDHPMIIKLVKSFKDQDRIYFLMEYVQGIDLFDALRELGLLNNESSRFYLACLMLIFEHLHERDIIFRDLKPENIMIDSEGYPKLIDFGTAKIIKQRTYTLVGTPHYMAPEVIKGIGYGLAADIWSIGVILFEFVCGYVPFGEGEEDPYKIYNKVLERVIKYPTYISSNRCKPMIEKMLDVNPAIRGNVQKLKENPWFVGTSWDALLGKMIKSPYIPKTDNFLQNLQKASKNNKSLAQIIQEEEDQEESPEKKIKKPPPANWDEDF